MNPIKNAPKRFLFISDSFNACIAGGIAQAFYKKTPADIVLEAREKLTKDLLVVVDQFNEKYKCRY